MIIIIVYRKSKAAAKIHFHLNLLRCLHKSENMRSTFLLFPRHRSAMCESKRQVLHNCYIGWRYYEAERKRNFAD